MAGRRFGLRWRIDDDLDPQRLSWEDRQRLEGIVLHAEEQARLRRAVALRDWCRVFAEIYERDAARMGLLQQLGPLPPGWPDDNACAPGCPQCPVDPPVRDETEFCALLLGRLACRARRRLGDLYDKHLAGHGVAGMTATLRHAATDGLARFCALPFAARTGPEGQHSLIELWFCENWADPQEGKPVAFPGGRERTGFAYTLWHELMHAFESSSARPKQFEDDQVFADGWMDEVAAALFRADVAAASGRPFGAALRDVCGSAWQTELLRALPLDEPHRSAAQWLRPEEDTLDSIRCCRLEGQDAIPGLHRNIIADKRQFGSLACKALYGFVRRLHGRDHAFWRFTLALHAAGPDAVRSSSDRPWRAEAVRALVDLCHYLQQVAARLPPSDLTPQALWAKATHTPSPNVQALAEGLAPLDADVLYVADSVAWFSRWLNRTTISTTGTEI